MIENIHTYSVVGKTIYTNILFPEIEVTDFDKYIISVSGDRLDNMSHEFYGTPEYWWIISVANNLRKDSMYVEPGLQLRIPDDIEQILIEYNQLNVNI